MSLCLLFISGDNQNTCFFRSSGGWADVEPFGDNSFEVPSMASLALSSGFPRQPSLPMVHADGWGPSCRGRKGRLAGQPRQLVEGVSLKDM